MTTKNDVFKVSSGLIEPDEKEKENIIRMAELIKVGCKEKKSGGNNWYEVASKNEYISLMKLIGFTHHRITWISRSHIYMPMKYLGWKDIYKKNINRYKMIAYGNLKWILQMNVDLINIILEYI
jgi:hypothetical protein